ncbi:hypothetical protein J7M02_05520 [Candidatus Aerophobetes bacterium]|nr:hypothetical protein [Candidatus Aerophobetes bacterium]
MNDTSYLMGIDIGTTYTKVGIYDFFGKEVLFKKTSTPMISHYYGEAEFNPNFIWRDLIKVIQEIPFKYRSQIKALSLSSFAETVYPLDSADNPLYNGIAWFDQRTKPQNKKVENLLGTSFIRKTTGLFPSWIYSINKILWFRENKPRLYQDVRTWLDNAGYIIFKLTGEKIIDYSLACRTMMFNVWEKRWDTKILDEFEIDTCVLPKPVPSGTVVGKVSKKASKEMGLSQNILVVSGGHDHLCAALSTGTIEKGKIQDSTGTTESILIGLKNAKKIDVEAAKESFTVANHVARDTFCLFQGTYCGGLLLDWFLDKVIGNVNYQIIEKIKCEQSIPMFIPYLRGSDFGPMSGALIGLKDFHDKNSVLCSIVEAIAFELKKMVDSLEKIIDTSNWVIRSIGGGAKNDVLLRYKANLLNKQVEVPMNQEASCHGAALLAGIGSGIYKNEVEAVKETLKISKVYSPESSQIEKIQLRYHKYRKIVTSYGDIEKTTM